MRQHKALCVDLRPNGQILAAVLSSPAVATSLEEIHTLNGLEDLQKLAKQINPKDRFTHAVVGVYPQSRFLRHATLETPSKAREEGFFEAYLKDQYQINIEEYSVAVLNPAQGVPVDLERVVPKELFFCGARLDELTKIQDDLVECGIYPDRLEIGSVATMGGVINYLKAQQISNPTVILEWGQTSTLLMIPGAKRVELLRVIPWGAEALLTEIKTQLGLKDEASAQKFLQSASFDFDEMGAALLKRLVKELQATMGFFEVQTGQTLKNMIISQLPQNLGWVEGVLAKYLGVEPMAVDFEGWANTLNLKSKVDIKSFSRQHMPLWGLMAQGDNNS